MKRLSIILLSGLAAVSLAQAGQTDVSLAPRAGGTDVSRFFGRQTPPQVLMGTAKLVEHYNPSQMLRLVFALRPPHMAEEEEFLKELHTKGSPNFHRFLTPEEWDSRFAPSVEDEQAVVDWARSAGFTVTHRFPDRLLVDVEAPAGTIEKVFGVTINRYQLGAEILFSNDRDPVIPARLAGIVFPSCKASTTSSGCTRRFKGRTIFPALTILPVQSMPPGPNLRSDGDHSKLPASMGGPAKGAVSNITNGNYDPTDIYSSQGLRLQRAPRPRPLLQPQMVMPGHSPTDSSIAIAAFGVPSSSDLTGFLHAISLPGLVTSSY